MRARDNYTIPNGDFGIILATFRIAPRGDIRRVPAAGSGEKRLGVAFDCQGFLFIFV